MPGRDVQSPHLLVEFLTAISRCHDSDSALHAASELVAEEFDAEVGAVVLGKTVRAVVGFGQREAPLAAIGDVAPGTRTTTLEGIGRCYTVTADWHAGT